MKARPALKLVTPAPTSPPQILRLGGTKPAADMKPDTYSVSCIGAAVKPGRWDVYFQVIDGPHTGTALYMWIPLPKIGEPLMPNNRLVKECEVALGRPLDTSDDLRNPKAIFMGRNFLVEVAWRDSEKPGGGKNNKKYGFKTHWKDEKDGLRVHSLIALVEL
jgi:hypothetical protein